ncbi:hypothetical protein [Methanobacterium sp. MBAC-LM]|jgi:hypothetical protein|uniref:hypothetical protein n=1 Tax=Methanobacterium sp. MBAC-LM TaxID=3412034 RepID=UPI003C74FF3F
MNIRFIGRGNIEETGKNKKTVAKDEEICEEEVEEKPEKIEECYICHKKFNINADDESYYWKEKYPFCAHCAEFYGFYR